MEQEEVKGEVVKTLLKFKESKRNGDLIGFVYVNKKGDLFGVREEDLKHREKKVCILSATIDKASVKPNVLYEVTLSDMPNYRGYIVETISLVKHKAKVYTDISKKECQAILAYGNKKIYYNPLKGKSPFSSTSEGALSLVNGFGCIANKSEAIKEFKKAINAVDEYISLLPKGKVETLISPKCFYQTIVSFGKRKIIYNPFDGKPHESDLSRVLKRIDNVLELTNKKEVKEAVLRSAKDVNRHMEADGYILPKQAI